MRLSEGQVHRRLSCAQTVRDQAPTVWSAFAAGSVDAYRVTMIADTITKLHRPASIAKLDTKVIGYAATHTSIELRGWLRRFVARVEADLFNERAEAERADRRVDITHGEDGMSWLNAYLPSHMAAAIDKRLTFEAKKITDDTRTVAQRRADLLAAWTTTNENGEAAVGADIAVVIDAKTLVGLSDAPASRRRRQLHRPRPMGHRPRRATRSGTPSHRRQRRQRPRTLVRRPIRPRRPSRRH